jgi:hypothetical protein
LCRQVVLLGRFAVCLRGKFVPFSGFPVFLMHCYSSCSCVTNSHSTDARSGPRCSRFRWGHIVETRIALFLVGA